MRLRQHAWGIAVAVIGAGAWACSADEPGEPSFIEEEDFAEALAADECAAVFDCGCPGLAWDDRADCREGVQQRRRDESFVADMHGLAYDGACAAKLIVRRQRIGCEISLAEDATPEEEEAASCAVPCKTYYGAKGIGEACERFGVTVAIDDCDQGLTCEQQVCVPLCEDAAPLEVGQICLAGIETRGRCEREAFCDEETKTCVRAPALGETCETRCGPGAWCDRAPEPPVCSALGDDGASCSLDEACISGTCENQACTTPAALTCG